MNTRYRKIKLTQGKYAVVDEADYESLVAFKWHARLYKSSGKWYAIRESPMVKGAKGAKIPMHRQIMGLDPGDVREVDHIRTMRTLDNRRTNLRIATHAQNAVNIEMRASNTSGYRGVYFHKLAGKWQAQIRVPGKRIYLGLFKTAAAAHRAYCAAAKEHHGEFARTK